MLVFLIFVIVSVVMGTLPFINSDFSPAFIASGAALIAAVNHLSSFYKERREAKREKWQQRFEVFRAISRATNYFAGFSTLSGLDTVYHLPRYNSLPPEQKKISDEIRLDIFKNFNNAIETIPFLFEDELVKYLSELSSKIILNLQRARFEYLTPGSNSFDESLSKLFHKEGDEIFEQGKGHNSILTQKFSKYLK